MLSTAGVFGPGGSFARRVLCVGATRVTVAFAVGGSMPDRGLVSVAIGIASFSAERVQESSYELWFKDVGSD